MKWSFQAIEDNILTLIIRDRNFAILVLGELKEDYFEEDTHTILYTITERYFKRYRGIPTLAEVEAIVTQLNLNRRFDRLHAERIYSEELTPSTMDFIRENIPKFIQMNNFEQLIREAAIQIPTITAASQEEMLTAFAQNFKNRVQLYNIDTDLGLNIYDVGKRYAILKKRTEIAIRPALGNMAKFVGYAAKELYSYIGDPSVGKSIMLATDAFAALQQGFNVVYISMEMAEEMLALRLDMGLMHETSRSLLSNKDVADILDKRYQSLKKNTGCGDLWIKEFPTGAANCNDIEKYLEILRMYKDFVPDFLVIDYGDIMRPNGKRSGDRYQDQGTVFQELRAMAKSLGIPILTAMQTNRPNKDNKYEKITEERIADSFDKLRTLDGCFSINRKFLEGNTLPNEHYIYIIKNRNSFKDVQVNFIMNKELMLVSEPNDRQPEEKDELASVTYNIETGEIS